MSGLGYASVPEGQRGWDGNWGTVKVQGPGPRPAGYVDPPSPEEEVEADVVTSWICRSCGCEQDVWGEGAVYSWMDCQRCGVASYLVMGEVGPDTRSKSP